MSEGDDHDFGTYDMTTEKNVRARKGNAAFIDEELMSATEDSNYPF